MRIVAGFAIQATAAAHASPTVSLDDPVYDEPADAWWIPPLDRMTVRATLTGEDDRAYSTPARPRDVSGVVALSCENQQGRPCGDGEGLVGELDSPAGHGQTAVAAICLLATTGTGGYANRIEIERAYARVGAGPALAELGRDVVALGPSERTSVAWSDHAPAFDQLRLQTARPYPLTPDLRGNLLYVVGQLRDPAQSHPPLVAIARVREHPFSRGEGIDISQDYTGQSYMLAPHLGALPYDHESRALRWTEYADLVLGFQTRHYEPGEMPVAIHRQTEYIGLMCQRAGGPEFAIQAVARPHYRPRHRAGL